MGLGLLDLASRTRAVIHTRSGEAEPSMFDEIRDPELRTAVEAAYEGWARKYPHMLEDWSE